jgi:hypothetical protein
MMDEREYLDTHGDKELRNRLKELSALASNMLHEVDLIEAEMKLIYNVMYNRRRARFLDEFDAEGMGRLPRTYTNYL